MSGSVDFVATGMDKQMHIGMIFEDLQKVFDTLDHEVLLEKMKYFGFWTSVINLFESYLSNLSQSLSDVGSYLYADDTCIFYMRTLTKSKMF